ncbi:MAG TPA: FliH/SctL family protein [Chloroflexota bacterium]|nr:FliH/SctL family protein [Chloroflexota bacterium]
MSRVLGRPDLAGDHNPLPRAWRGPTGEQQASGEARADSARMIFEARVRSRALLAEARASAVVTLEEETRQARARGYAEGLELARREYQGSVQRVADLVAAAQIAHTENARHLDQVALTLALALARLVVRRELTAVPDTLLEVARGALGEMALDAEVSIRVHSDDVALLRERLHELGIGALLAVAVVGDPALSAGSCVIRSGPGQVDASVDTQLARAERLLREQISVE